MFPAKVLISMISLVLLGVQCTPLQRDLLSNEDTSSEPASTYVENYDSDDSLEATTELYLLFEVPLVKRSIPESLENQQAAEINSNASPNEDNDMEVAETHLFRPVFRYKSQYAERRRIRQIPPQFAVVVQQ
uniref:Putative secreted protein n=1 Tax=Aedes albopictus TaxID=7160 RepID=A0A023EGB1_AEDAL